MIAGHVWSPSRRMAHVARGRMDEEKLIEAVRGFPCLWQVSSKSYKGTKAKGNVWKVVALIIARFDNKI